MYLDFIDFAKKTRCAQICSLVVRCIWCSLTTYTLLLQQLALFLFGLQKFLSAVHSWCCIRCYSYYSLMSMVYSKGIIHKFFRISGTLPRSLIIKAEPLPKSNSMATKNPALKLIFLIIPGYVRAFNNNFKSLLPTQSPSNLSNLLPSFGAFLLQVALKRQFWLLRFIGCQLDQVLYWLVAALVPSFHQQLLYGLFLSPILFNHHFG